MPALKLVKKKTIFEVFIAAIILAYG